MYILYYINDIYIYIYIYYIHMCVLLDISDTLPKDVFQIIRTQLHRYSLFQPFDGKLFITAHFPPIHIGKGWGWDHLKPHRHIALLRWPGPLIAAAWDDEIGIVDVVNFGRRKPGCARAASGGKLPSCNHTWLAEKSPIDGGLNMSHLKNHQPK